MRPGSSTIASLFDMPRLHRRGCRSDAARRRRAEARTPQFLSLSFLPVVAARSEDFLPSLADTEDFPAVRDGSRLRPAAGPAVQDGSRLRPAVVGKSEPQRDDSVVVESCVSFPVNDYVASGPPNGADPGDNSSSFGRSGQSGPSTESISDIFSVFHLNPQGIETEAKRAQFDALVQHIQQQATRRSRASSAAYRTL